MKALKVIFSGLILMTMLFQACQKPERGYCSVTLIDSRIEESPSLEAIVEEGELQIICSFSGMDILDTLIYLDEKQNEILWAEIEKQKFKTYYKEGPEWQLKQTNLQDINEASNASFKSKIFEMCPLAKQLIEESLQKAKKILPPTEPTVPPIDTRDTLSAD